MKNEKQNEAFRNNAEAVFTIVRPSRNSPRNNAAHRRTPLDFAIFSCLVIASSLDMFDTRMSRAREALVEKI